MTVYVAFNYMKDIVGIFHNTNDAQKKAESENGHIEIWTVE